MLMIAFFADLIYFTGYYCEEFCICLMLCVFLLSPHLVLVFRMVGVVLLQRGEVTALWAGLNAGVQLIQLQKVTIFCHILTGQMGNHHSLLQFATALQDRTADVKFGYSHLGNITDR